MIRLFISHSERDEKLVSPLKGWLQSGLGLKDFEIRCTSVAETNMMVGKFPAEALRSDLLAADAVVGLLTAHSLDSHWAQLEMGAAWLRETLHPIRGPGIEVSDLPSPLSDFTTVGYCERGKMQNLLEQLAKGLGVATKDDAHKELEEISRIAQTLLVEDMVKWFSLPPVLSAWRIDNDRFEFALQSLCGELGLRRKEVEACASASGKLTRDPDDLPPWAVDLWTVAKEVVNTMLRPGDGEPIDVPPEMLSDRLIADLRRGLSSKRDRPKKMRAWLDKSQAWIAEHPPSRSRQTHRRAHRR